MNGNKPNHFDDIDQLTKREEASAVHFKLEFEAMIKRMERLQAGAEL